MMRQRLSSKWLAIGCLLYGFAAAAASETTPATEPAAADQPVGGAPAAPFVGVILPLQSKQLGPIADAIKSGINAALAVDGKNGPAVRFYPASEQSDDVLFVYRQARDEGAKAVIGPLTKPAIAELVKSDLATLPTIVLNTPDAGSKSSPQVFNFGIGIDSEARQMARIAFAEGKRKALSLALDSVFSKRLQNAFAEEWKALGGELNELQLSSRRPNYSLLRATVEEKQPDMAFLAVDARTAKALRSYLGETPLYATSQISNGRPNSGTMRALAGLSYVDMPWLLDPKAATVAPYARPAKRLNVDIERMYALGIDAYRLAAQLAGGTPARLALDGVSGHIELGPHNQLLRKATPSIIGLDDNPDSVEEPDPQ